MILTLPYPPSLNRMYRSVVIGRFARVLLSKEAREYKDAVALRCIRAGLVTPILKPQLLSIEIRLFRPRRSGDIDGALKGLLDSMQGFVYENDSQIKELHVVRGDDKHNPRVEVTVSELAA